MERDWNTQTAGVKLEISTHTLTWSVTFRPHFCAKMIQYFNSHAHVERDFEFFDNEMYIPNFNSHAHVERDKDQNGNYVINDISTHTLTWSVTITY